MRPNEELTRYYKGIVCKIYKQRKTQKFLCFCYYVIIYTFILIFFRPLEIKLM